MGKTTFSGPVAGAYITIPVISGASDADTVTADALIPSGMKVKLFGVTIGCRSANGASVTLGTASDADGYLTSKTFTSSATGYHAFDGALGSVVEITDSDDLIVTTSVTTALTDGFVYLHGYVTQHTTDLNREGAAS